MIEKDILKTRIVGIVGSENEGKTTALFHFINYVKSNFKRDIVCYFYHVEYRRTVKGVKHISTLDELEQIKDSFIFIDEFAELFQLSNRHFKHQVEKVFNMIAHNNNVVVLCGVPSYYRQFIASRVKSWVLKTIKYKDCVNGSALKEYINTITGDFVGSTMISVDKTKMLIRGVLYDVPYDESLDKKASNVDLFTPKNVTTPRVIKKVK